jgi:hypothetical protein
VTSAAAPERRLGRAGVLALIGLVVIGALLASSDLLALGSFATNGVVGAFLIWRRPRNVIGWILLAIAFAWVANSSYPGVDVDALIRGDATPRDSAIAWFNGWSGRAVFVGFLALSIVFPSGHLSTGRGRRTDIALLAIASGILLVTPFAPTLSVDPTGSTVSIVIANPVGILPGPADAWAELLETADLVYIGLLAIGVVRLLLRYRRSSGVERLQFRWLVAAFSSILAAIVFGLAVTVVAGDDAGPAAWIPVSVAYSTIAIAIGIAVMRYRLFEIDRIISRTIAYAIVTGLLAAVFGAIVLVLSTVLAQVGQGEMIAVAASTLAVFALFQPVLRRVRHRVDRRFNRARYDAELTAAAFSTRLRDEVDIGTVTAALDSTVRRAVDPTVLGLWLRPPRHEPMKGIDPVTISGRSGGKLSAT